MFHVDGADVDPSSVTLDSADGRLARQHIAAAKAALRPESDQTKRRAKSAYTAKLMDRGVSRERAERAAESVHDRKTLFGSDVVVFDGGQSVTVGELLGPRGVKRDEKGCLDPLEPDYDGGRVVAKFFRNHGERPVIYSFARGERVFHLRHDASSAASAIEDAAGDKDAIVRAIALADVSALEMTQLEDAACKALRLGKRVKALRGEVSAYRRRHGLDRHETDDEGDVADVAPVAALDARIPVAEFPQVKTLGSGDMYPIGHVDNVAHLLERYGFDYCYNEITKEIEWAHPDCQNEGDNRDNLLSSQVLGLCNMNGVPTKDLDTFLAAVAERRC